MLRIQKCLNLNIYDDEIYNTINSILNLQNLEHYKFCKCYGNKDNLELNCLVTEEDFDFPEEIKKINLIKVEKCNKFIFENDKCYIFGKIKIINKIELGNISLTFVEIIFDESYFFGMKLINGSENLEKDSGILNKYLIDMKYYDIDFEYLEELNNFEASFKKSSYPYEKHFWPENLLEDTKKIGKRIYSMNNYDEIRNKILKKLTNGEYIPSVNEYEVINYNFNAYFGNLNYINKILKFKFPISQEICQDIREIFVLLDSSECVLEDTIMFFSQDYLYDEIINYADNFIKLKTYYVYNYDKEIVYINVKKGTKCLYGERSDILFFTYENLEKTLVFELGQYSFYELKFKENYNNYDILLDRNIPEVGYYKIISNKIPFFTIDMNKLGINFYFYKNSKDIEIYKKMWQLELVYIFQLDYDEYCMDTFKKEICEGFESIHTISVSTIFNYFTIKPESKNLKDFLGYYNLTTRKID